VDADAASDRRIGLALDLARRLNAALIAVAACAPKPTVSGDIVGDEPDEREVQRATQWLDDLGKHVRAIVGPRENVEWRDSMSYPDDFVSREAATADLVIVGRDRGDGGSYRSLDAGSTVLKAGCPVLIVPGHVGSLQARRILVAWKNTREARRALRDAIPLLREAEEVTLISLTERTSLASTPVPLEQVGAYLARHKVPVGAPLSVETKSNVARELIGYAEEQGADLIVAGGYGLSRLGEWIFGGVTRELIVECPICCFLSH